MKPFEALAPGASAPVFREPWEAQAFAMTVSLHEKGLFTWAEWSAALAAEAAQDGMADLDKAYYLRWLAALEKLAIAKGAADAAGLEHTRDAWDRAARSTPHGQPITLNGRER